MREIDQLLLDYIRELQVHDWWHAMSDDHSVWRRGETHAKAIESMRERLRAQGFGEVVDVIYNKYCPNPAKVTP